MKRLMAAVAVAMVSFSASATETLRYDWRLRGALSWVARVRFPTSGVGVLHTRSEAGGVASQLRITSTEPGAYLEYSSRMDTSGHRTLTSANGYAFGDRSERKETVYDYATHLARISEREGGHVSSKTKPLSVDVARDVLTTIAYLREHATELSTALTTEVYSDGKPYHVSIQPAGVETMQWNGRSVRTREFRVVAAAGAKKKFPGLTVWISEDERRLPLRIVLDQSFASLDLRLRPV